MIFRRSLTLLLFGWVLILAGCGSSNDPPVVRDNPNAVTNSGQLQVDVLTLNSVAAAAVNAQQALDLDHFVIKIEGLPDQVLDPSELGTVHSVLLQGLADGVVEVTLLAQNSQNQTLAHYQALVEVPGNLVVHILRFEVGDVAPDVAGQIDEWILQSSTPVVGAPGLTETIWKADVSLPGGTPRSPYDTIGLHRLVGVNPAPGKVVVYLPGASANASLYTNLEDRDFRLYLANRGYDVYSLDYRTHFVPPFTEPGVEIPPLVTSDLSLMVHWDSATFVSDTAMAIAQAKEVSGSDKVFLAGFSSGGQITYFYTASNQLGGLGQDQLRGIIALDGGPWQISGPAAPNTLDLVTARAALAGGDTPANRAVLATFGATPDAGFYSNGLGSLDEHFVSAVLAYVLDPDAGDPLGDGSAADYLVFRMQNLWGLNGEGDGQFTNVQRGYNSLDMLLVFAVLATDGYWPVIQDLEDSVLSNRCGPLDGPFTLPIAPDVEYLANLPEVNIPQLVFGSSGLDSFVGTRISWKFAGIVMSSSQDVERHLVQHFGHIDLLCGTQVTSQISQPMFEWLERH